MNTKQDIRFDVDSSNEARKWAYKIELYFSDISGL